MNKIVLITYNPEMMCFMHVLLYALDFHGKGYEVKVVIEGGAVKLIPALGNPEAPFAALWEKVKAKGLVDCVCKACSTQLGTLAEAESQGLRVAGEMVGHPSLEHYIERGYRVLTF